MRSREQTDDQMSINTGCSRPIGMEIHRAERRSHVRLKHKDEQ